MRARQILLLNAAGVAAYRCRGGSVSLEAAFPAGDIEEFDRYVGKHARDIFSLLVDVVDESYATEYLPHVFGPSRRAQLARMRSRHCHGSALCLAQPQGRRADGRRDDRYLFAALTKPRAIEPWLHSLGRAAALLRGVYSLPQLVAGFHRAGDMPCLLTTWGGGGLRQTFCLDGHLRFSRLSALPGNELEHAAATCAAEAANMRRYLCGQRLAERDTPLRVLVLAHPAHFDAFRRHCPNSEELRFDYLDIGAEAAHRRIAGSFSDSCSDALFAGMLAQRPPRQQFARPAMTRAWRSHRIARALDLAGLAGVAASLLFAAMQLPVVLDMREATLQMSLQNDREEEGQGVGRQGPDALPPGDLLALGAAMDALDRLSPGPSPLLHRLSRTLEDIGSIELQRLEWRIAGELDKAKGPFAILDVHGQLTTDREARNEVGRLVEHLRATPKTQVSIVKPPFAMDSGRALRSADAAASDGSFTVRIGQAL